MKITIYNVVNWIFAALLIYLGVYWSLKVYWPFTPTLLNQWFAGPGVNATEYLVDHQMIVFPLWGPRFIPILAISILLLGLLMLGLDRTNPKIAIPLWLMACGAFDVFGNTNLLARLSSGDFWPWFQLCLMVGGWALAGFPRFKPDKWLALLIAVSVLTLASGDGRPFELALFWYIITSTEPNLWGKKG